MSLRKSSFFMSAMSLLFIISHLVQAAPSFDTDKIEKLIIGTSSNAADYCLFRSIWYPVRSRLVVWMNGQYRLWKCYSNGYFYDIGSVYVMPLPYRHPVYGIPNGSQAGGAGA